jgi:hypothetical protein
MSHGMQIQSSLSSLFIVLLEMIKAAPKDGPDSLVY